ncbi:glycoside hydrolase [Rickenella mellea]|uniref:chitinase n=1 Tax=Rickenella mellea TaxID=50990 RepID=A0A4Y7PT77_9AGAM|nr:glycoside hydrolase [Rickenella mellea]
MCHIKCSSFSYWGQNSYGATHRDTANFQQHLSNYCGSDSVINVIPLAFLNVFFGSGGQPSIHLANTCNPTDNATFPGTDLPNCAALASDIQTCQAKGKIVTLSLGGATGAVGFSSDTQARTFADTIWNDFLGGSSSTRPFGNAILDGIDLDIESGSSAFYDEFVEQISYYVTATPHCAFPDPILGGVINTIGFDAIYVQFCKFCGLQNFSNQHAWNFGTWGGWAKTVSPNKNVKVFIGVPASSSAADSGYVDPATLATIIQQTKAQYSSFGGVMLWDASQAYANNPFDISAKNARTGGSSSSSNSQSPTSNTCSNVLPWSSSIAYTGGMQVVYNDDNSDHLWTAKEWSEANFPGGAAGLWTDDGSCRVGTPSALVPAAPAPAHEPVRY